MDISEIQQKVAMGFAKAASIAGVSVLQYRPVSVNDPLLGNVHRIIYSIFDKTSNFSCTSTMLWSHPFCYAALDTTDIMVGDYLAGYSTAVDAFGVPDIYFVARFEAGRPLLTILTNEIISIYESDVSSNDQTFGLRSPEGPIRAKDVIIAQNWPVSFLAKHGGAKPPVRLGTDLASDIVSVLMPRPHSASIKQGQRIKTSTGLYFHISSVEYSGFGLRLDLIADQV